MMKRRAFLGDTLSVVGVGSSSAPPATHLPIQAAEKLEFEPSSNRLQEGGMNRATSYPNKDTAPVDANRRRFLMQARRRHHHGSAPER
jgi:hypothetical protein